MKNLWALSTQALSRALGPRERETVLGDLAELDRSDRKAFKSVLGLVVRRQLGLWRNWEPWFVLVAIVVPVGPLLATQSNWLSLSFFPNLVMWLHDGISYRSGISSAALFMEVCFRASALITWSWTSAYALGALPRKTIWTNGFLFFLFCAVFAVYSSPYPVRALWMTPWAWVPIENNFLLVLLPVYCGLHESAKSPRTTPPWLIPLAGWTVIIGGLAFWTQGWYGAALDNWSQGAPALSLVQLTLRADLWKALVAHFGTLTVLTGPIVYLFAMKRFFAPRVRISIG